MMLLHYRPVPAKIPKRRSRAGCIHCKEKKKKCNEERPQCDRCMERGLKCQYEPVKPRKRRRTTTTIEQDQQRARSVTSDPGPQTGHQANVRGTLPGGVRNVLNDYRHHSIPPSSLDDPWGDDGSGYDSSVSSLGDLFVDSVDGLPPLQELNESIPYPTHILPSSCTSVDFHLPPATVGVPYAADYARTDFSRSPSVSHFFSPPSSKPNSSYADLAMMTPASMAPSSQYNSPAFEEFSRRRNRRVLVDHFCNVLSHLLVFKEEPGNPFRDFILPLASRSPPVMNAIYALSAAHMEHRGIENEERSLDFHSRTLQGLAHLIADHKTTRDEALAVIVLLLYYEIVRSGSPIVLNSHLRGALSIIRERRASHGLTCAFLEKAFRYVDVICALSFGTSPISGSVGPHSGSSGPLSPQESSPFAAVDPQFGLSSDLWPIIHRLARLRDLRLEINRLDHQAPGRVEPMRQDLETQAATLELALMQWVPPQLPTGTADNMTSTTSAPMNHTHQPSPPAQTLQSSSEDSRLQSILSSAEAYKQATFVHLFRSVHNYPRNAPKVQHHVKQCLQACLRVVIFAGPMSALLWPLFTAACEAVDDVDRNVARTVFRHLENRQGMKNIVQAWEVTEEVWRRQDEGESDVEWRAVALDMGEGVMLG